MTYEQFNNELDLLVVSSLNNGTSFKDIEKSLRLTLISINLLIKSGFD